jgi:glutathione synthase/RimK-type ligase-like ATP-grasp enzyme
MILIISNTTDLTSDFVVRELTKRNLKFARLNTDEFPINGKGTVSYKLDGKPSKVIKWKNRKNHLDFNSVESVLYRRPTKPRIDPRIKDDSVMKFCTDESNDFLRGIWYSMNCYWMSSPEAIRKAEHKVFQLEIAKKIGFSIPETLISNDPERIKSFFRLHPKGVIVKPLYLGFIDKGKKSEFIYTTSVHKSDLKHISKAIFAPSIYQQLIKKDFDVRVTVIGEKVFAARIDALNLPKDMPDWRFASIEELRHQKITLPSSIATKCLKLVKSLGLDFGAIDLAVDTHGNYIFFEINPNGQWAWLEVTLDFPLSKEIVNRLVEMRGHGGNNVF